MIGIYGAGCLGLELLAYLESKGEEVVFIDDARSGKFEGCEIITFAEAVNHFGKSDSVLLGISDPGAREEKLHACTHAGLQVGTLDKSLWMSATASASTGCLLAPGSTVGPNSTLGTCVILNYGVVVAHDVDIGDFSSLAPGVVVNGNVSIGKGVRIGASASLCNGHPSKKLIVGDFAEIGMGSVVITNLKSGVRVFGNPARPY